MHIFNFYAKNLYQKHKVDQQLNILCNFMQSGNVICTQNAVYDNSLSFTKKNSNKLPLISFYTKMDRKGKNSSLEQRKLVLQLYLKGEKYKKIRELLNINSNK